MSYSINFKGEIDSQDKNLVKIEMIFFKTGYNRVPKVIDITGLYKDWGTNLFKETNKVLIQKNKLLTDLKLKYLSVIEEWEIQKVNWAPAQLSHHFDKPKVEEEKVTVLTVSECFDKTIQMLKNRKRVKNGIEISSVGTAAGYNTVYNSLTTFTKTVYHKDFSSYYFRDISEQFLKDYVNYLKLKGLNAGLEPYVRKFCGLFIYSKKMKQPDTALDNFRCLNIYPKRVRKKPKTIDYNIIVDIENMDKSQFSQKEQFDIDMFLFSLYCGGLAIIDTCYFSWDYIIDGFIDWERIKYSKKARMPFTDKARAIAEKYREMCVDNYVMPVFSKKHIEESQKRGRMKRLRERVNKTLRKVSAILGYKPFTWYSARGTFITKMLNEGYNPIDVCIFSGNSPSTIMNNYYEQVNPEQVIAGVNSIFNGQKIERLK